MSENYNDLVDTLGKLATLAVAETAVIGVYLGYSVCKAVYKIRAKKAEKNKAK